MMNIYEYENDAGQVTPDSVYDKLRMFNGQAASWAWYGATPSATHLGLPAAPPTHPALPHPFQTNREILEDKKPGRGIKLVSVVSVLSIILRQL